MGMHLECLIISFMRLLNLFRSTAFPNRLGIETPKRKGKSNSFL